MALQKAKGRVSVASPPIEEMRLPFDNMTTAQKKEYIDRLETQLKGKPSAFLSECIEKYNTELRDGSPPLAIPSYPATVERVRNPLTGVVVALSVALVGVSVAFASYAVDANNIPADALPVETSTAPTSSTTREVIETAVESSSDESIPLLKDIKSWTGRYDAESGFFTLDTPLMLWTDEDTIMEVDSIQIMDDAQTQFFADIIRSGQPLTLTGYAFWRHTRYHHRPVLLNKISSVKIADTSSFRSEYQEEIESKIETSPKDLTDEIIGEWHSLYPVDFGNSLRTLSIEFKADGNIEMYLLDDSGGATLDYTYSAFSVSGNILTITTYRGMDEIDFTFDIADDTLHIIGFNPHIFVRNQFESVE